MTTKLSPRTGRLAWQILLTQVAVTFVILIIGVISGWTGTNQFASGMFLAGVAALLLGGGGLMGSNYADGIALFGSSASRGGPPHDLVTQTQNNPERTGIETLMRVSLGVGVISILIGFLLTIWRG